MEIFKIKVEGWVLHLSVTLGLRLGQGLGLGLGLRLGLRQTQ